MKRRYEIVRTRERFNDTCDWKKSKAPGWSVTAVTIVLPTGKHVKRKSNWHWEVAIRRSDKRRLCGIHWRIICGVEEYLVDFLIDGDDLCVDEANQRAHEALLRFILEDHKNNPGK